MKNISVYDKYLQNLENLAEETYKNHKLRSSGEGRWIIQVQRDDGSWDGIYYTEIVNLGGGGILVHGDGDTCLFKYYNGEKHVTSKARWLASSGVDYLEQKCSIGMDDGSVARTFDDEVALWELEEACPRSRS